MQKKTIFIAVLFVAAIQFVSLKANCQKRFAKYIPAEGFWVLVSNIHVKHVTNVQYYNNDKKLIYEEEVVNVKFNLKRVKTLRWLREGFDKALIAFTKTKQPLKDSNWVADIVKR